MTTVYNMHLKPQFVAIIIFAFAINAITLASPSLARANNLRKLNCPLEERKNVILMARGGGFRRAPKMQPVTNSTLSDNPKTMSLRFAVISGLILAFNSGYINGNCLSGLLAWNGFKQGVAAVTGAYTTSALGLHTGHLDFVRIQMGVILSFLSGSAIAGLLNPKPVHFQLSPSTGPAFLIGSLFMVASSRLAGESNSGAFLYLAAVANGIQNSITSAHTSNLIRTTHYSGITSDMGTFLGQVLRGNTQNLQRLKIFAALAACFWMGGWVSWFAAETWEGNSLLASAGLYFLIGGGLMLFS